MCEEDEQCINCLYVCEDRIGLWCGLDGEIVRYNTYCIKWEERDPERIERYLYDGTIQPRKVQ